MMDRWIGGLTGVAAVLLFAGCASNRHVVQDAHSTWALNATPLDRSAAELDNDTHEHLTWAKVYRQRILSEKEPRSIENTLVPYNELLMHLDAARGDCELFLAVHPDARVRKAAAEGLQAVAEAYADLEADEPLREALRELDLSRTDADTRRFVATALNRSVGARGEPQSAYKRDASRLEELHRRLTERLARTFAQADRSEAGRSHGAASNAGTCIGVVRAMLDVASAVLGIRVEQVHGLNRWQPSVSAWDVYDGSEKRGRTLVQLDCPAVKPGEVKRVVLRRGARGRRLPQSVLIGNLGLSGRRSGAASLTKADAANLAAPFTRVLQDILHADSRWVLE
ncbi:MAG: hypothetical protein PVI86_16260 [Phycisphaerae bacterium]